MSKLDKERGRWFMGHSDPVAAVQAEAEDNGWSPAEVIQALYERDLLPKPTYYVPGLDEYYRTMSDLRYAIRSAKIPVRWVMCRETLAEMDRRYGRRRVPDVIEWSFTMADDDLPPPEELLNLVDRPANSPAQLFGVPIRVDPAARTPLFEIRPDGG